MADADVESSAASLLKGGFYHAGQVCVSVQRIFADDAVADHPRAALDSQANGLAVGNPSEPNTVVGPLIRPVEVERVDSWVKESARTVAVHSYAAELQLPSAFMSQQFW